jgi:hypothetical protein
MCAPPALCPAGRHPPQGAKASLAAATHSANTANVRLTAAEAQVRETESQKAALVRDAQAALGKAGDLKQALNVFKEKARPGGCWGRVARTRGAAWTARWQREADCGVA